jgi:hypothetical protein
MSHGVMSHECGGQLNISASANPVTEIYVQGIHHTQAVVGWSSVVLPNKIYAIVFVFRKNTSSSISSLQWQCHEKVWSYKPPLLIQAWTVIPGTFNPSWIIWRGFSRTQWTQLWRLTRPFSLKVTSSVYRMGFQNSGLPSFRVDSIRKIKYDNPDHLRVTHATISVCVASI